MTSPIEAIAARVLDDHYPAPVWCKCGWRAGMSLNDTRSDQRQTLNHVAAEIARAVAEDEGLVELAAPGLDIAIHQSEFVHAFQERQARAVIDALTREEDR